MKRWVKIIIMFVTWLIGGYLLVINDSYNMNLTGAFIMGVLFGHFLFAKSERRVQK